MVDLKQKNLLTDDDITYLINNTTEWRKEKHLRKKQIALVRMTEQEILSKVSKAIEEMIKGWGDYVFNKDVKGAFEELKKKLGYEDE